MKKFLSLTAALLAVGFASAQTTFDFENWGSQLGSFPQPTGWTSANVIGAAGNDSVLIKAVAPHVFAGNAAMKIETIKLSNNLGSSIGLPDTVCWAITGSIVTIPTTSVKTGFPYTTRANVMTFYYKYSPVNGDSATAGVVLTKWNGSSRDTVATGKIHMGAQGTYAVDSVGLTYTSAYATSGNPDTANIYFASSYVKSFAISGTMSISYKNPQIGSMLWIDDCSTQLVGINEAKAAEEVAFFPNPVQHQLNFRFENAAERSVEIVDLAGKLVIKEKLKEKNCSLNTAALSSGVYFFKLRNGAGQVISVQKFMKAD